MLRPPVLELHTGFDRNQWSNRLEAPLAIRRPEDSRKVQALRPLVFRDVLLHLLRLLRTVPAWKAARHGRRNRAARSGVTSSIAGNERDHDPSKPYAVSHTNAATQSRPTAQHHVRRSLQRPDGVGHPRCVAFLSALWAHRDRLNDVGCLVFLDMAEAAKWRRFDLIKIRPENAVQ